jgi:hypothetical protein
MNTIYYDDDKFISLLELRERISLDAGLCDMRHLLMILCDRLEAAEKHLIELQSEIDALNTSTTAQDLRWQRQSGKPLEEWESEALKEYEDMPDVDR